MPGFNIGKMERDVFGAYRASLEAANRRAA
jgi:hypothetical protein